MDDYFALLDLDPDEADPAAIKAAYRRAAKTNHPDAGGDPTVFRAVSDAYAVLSDPKLAALYRAEWALRKVRERRARGDVIMAGDYVPYVTEQVDLAQEFASGVPATARAGSRTVDDDGDGYHGGAYDDSDDDDDDLGAAVGEGGFRFPPLSPSATGHGAVYEAVYGPAPARPDAHDWQRAEWASDRLTADLLLDRRWRVWRLHRRPLVLPAVAAAAVFFGMALMSELWWTPAVATLFGIDSHIGLGDDAANATIAVSAITFLLGRRAPVWRRCWNVPDVWLAGTAATTLIGGFTWPLWSSNTTGLAVAAAVVLAWVVSWSKLTRPAAYRPDDAAAACGLVAVRDSSDTLVDFVVAWDDAARIVDEAKERWDTDGMPGRDDGELASAALRAAKANAPTWPGRPDHTRRQRG